jgi:hypothetical protein
MTAEERECAKLSVVRDSRPPAVVAQLESVLELARKGEVTGIALVTYSPKDGVGYYGCGAFTARPELAIGAITKLLVRFLRK